MPDSSKQNLSEISHLFLTSIRERQGGPRPVRRPPMPPQPQMQVVAETALPLMPEEVASVAEMVDAKSPTANPHREESRIAPVTAVIAAHLGATQIDRVRQYARHLSSTGQRIGLIEIDAGEFRLRCFDHTPPATAPTAEPHGTELLDPRHIAEAIEELNCDVDRWLLLTPAPRTPEARALLRQVRHWTLLTATDHDGIVACYRTLKGLADLGRPLLHLAVLDQDAQHAQGVIQKLSSVCHEFLGWPANDGERVQDDHDVAEHMVMSWRPTQDKTQLASTAHWEAVSAILARAEKSDSGTGFQPVNHGLEARATAQEPARPAMHLPIQPAQAAVPDMVIPAAAPAPAPAPAPIPQPTLRMTTDAPVSPEPTQVVDLPAGDMSEPSILSAVVHGDTSLVELPVQPPMCPAARLAVDRQRRIILLAVARRGLSDLREIGRAYQWMNENRALIAMAVPQLNIDAHALPRLTLLVDHNDLSAAVLQPMFESTAVTVQAYRTLRWGPKTGLLLEAA